MDLAALGFPANQPGAHRNRVARQAAQQTRFRDMLEEEQALFMEDNRLRRISPMDAAMLFQSVNLRPVIPRVILTDQLHDYARYCYRRFSHQAPSPTTIFGPDLVCRVVVLAARKAFAQGLRGNEQTLLANPATFLISPQDAPSQTSLWLAKSLIEDPILMHGALVHPETRVECANAGVPLLSICPLCHQHSTLRAQIREELIPFPSRTQRGRRSVPHRFQRNFISVDDVLGHCQIPRLAMQGEDRNQDLRYYEALHHLVHSTIRILSEKKSRPIPTENNARFFLFQALQVDLQRAPPSDNEDNDTDSSDDDEDSVGPDIDEAPAANEINQQNANQAVAINAQANATAQANAAAAAEARAQAATISQSNESSKDAPPKDASN